MSQRPLEHRNVTDNNLPPPLVHPDVDLSNMEGFLLNAVRLLGSELAALSSGEEFKAAVLLWCRAWLQKPHASLPDKDDVLAKFVGVSIAKWKKLRPMALRGWVKCSDGRLYHSILAEDANRAHAARLKNHKRTEAANEKRRKQADAQRNVGRNVPRDEERDDQRDEPRNEERDVGRNVERNVQPFPSLPSPSSEPKGSDAGASRPPSEEGKPKISTTKAVIDFGIALLTSAGQTEKSARDMIGKWRKDLKDDVKLMGLLVSAREQDAAEPIAYVTKAVRNELARASEAARQHEDIYRGVMI